MQHRKTRIALTLLSTMILGFILFAHISKALTINPPDISSEKVLHNYPFSVNGAERELIITESDVMRAYLKIENYPDPICITVVFTDGGRDEYGTIHIICNKSVYWWDYDLDPDLYPITWHPVLDPDTGSRLEDIESFEFEGSGSNAVVVGYKTFSGKTYPIPTLDEKRKIVQSDSPTQPTQVPSTQIPSTQAPPAQTSPTSVPSTQTPSTQTPPTPVPSTQTPSTQTPPTQFPPESPTVPTVLNENPPTITAEPTATPDVKSKPSYTLKKGTLSWKAGKKKGTAKGVKQVAYTKKGKLIFLDKKGRTYTISKNGKKTLIVKKGTKKFIYAGTGKHRYVSKVKTNSGSAVKVS